MKRTVKLVLAVVLALCLGATSLLGVSARGTEVTISRADQLCYYAQEGYNNTLFGPISITEGCFKTSAKDKGTAVYLVGIAGLDPFGMLVGGYNDLLATQESANNIKGRFYNRVVQCIKKQCPKGANLIITGHSLGGMIGQQIAADKAMQKRYNILLNVCFGSPVVAAGEKKEGVIIRYEDKNDVVPKSGNNVLAFASGGNDAIVEDGGFGLDALNAHNQSYALSGKFNKYDVCGKKNGTACIILDLDTRVWYKATALKMGLGND